MLAYKVTIPEMMPSTLIVSGYNASSTEEVVGQVKQSFIKQQCQIDIQKSDNQNEPSYELFDSNYKCGDQGDMSAWRARFAVVPAGNIFYVVAAATLEKNWANAQLEIGTILNSISITKPTGSEDLKNTNDAGGDNNQNDETIQ